jgi:hypothetical protein
MQSSCHIYQSPLWPCNVLDGKGDEAHDEGRSGELLFATFASIFKEAVGRYPAVLHVISKLGKMEVWSERRVYHDGFGVPWALSSCVSVATRLAPGGGKAWCEDEDDRENCIGPRAKYCMSHVRQVIDLHFDGNALKGKYQSESNCEIYQLLRLTVKLDRKTGSCKNWGDIGGTAQQPRNDQWQREWLQKDASSGVPAHKLSLPL